MSIEIKTPLLPESVADATVAKWHKQPGEAIMRDEPLVDIETDKVVLEVVAPADGSMEKILCAEGTVVKAEQVIGLFAAHAVSLAATETQPKAAKSQTAPTKDPVAQATMQPDLNKNPVLSPSVRRTVAEQGLD